MDCERSGYGPGMLQAGIHAGFGINEPDLEEACGALRVARFVENKGGGTQREDCIAHGVEGGPIGLETRRVDFVPANGGAGGVVGIGPPVGVVAVIFVRVEVDDLGRSEVTVQGPSFIRFSASMRRRRTESRVQASRADNGAVDRLGFVVRDERHRNVRGTGTRQHQHPDQSGSHPNAIVADAGSRKTTENRQLTTRRFAHRRH